LRDLSFRYASDGPWVLENIDFTVEPGAFVAIVGPSGSGKSTLLRLLLGFETPTLGSIFYDNKALATLDLRLLRPQIGTVLQNAGLVPGSIRDNIVGAARLDDAEVSAAVAMAGLDADVAAMPMGLETFVAEGGSTLSGGQRQRVMIARAIVRKPAILLFDEATSALDNRTQAVVAASLASLNATRMVIAHRLSTVRDADMILVLEGGRIVERGRYADLMEAKGAFFRLARRQLF
jgi:ABC-type bacteriocin/lantibiotic exporter with double-glycine peptidase domain